MTESMLFAEVELELTAPVTIAAPEREDGGDGSLRSVAREGWHTDGLNAPWIPPSSLAGSFRAHLGEERACVLMGKETEPDDGTDADEASGREGRPSLVRFLGTEVQLADHADATGPLPQRRRTAIDRHRAAPDEGKLHSSEQLPPGTTVLCYLRVDGGDHNEVLQALRTWHPVLGSGRTVGQGGTRTRRIRHRVIDLSTREGRRAWLTGGGLELLTGADHLAPDPQESPEPLLTAEWEVVDALHIGAGEHPPGEAAKLLRDGAGRPLIPGSTWKGILRSRCTYILTSLGLPDAESLVCDAYDCGDCAMCAAFGSSPTPDTPGSRGLLRFSDTPLLGAVVRERQHVALDRVFGGAADSLLYAHEVAETGRVTLRIDTDGDISPTVLAALHHALYDLHSGLLGIGGSTTRGYGTLRCTDPEAAERWRTAATAHFARLLEPA